MASKAAIIALRHRVAVVRCVRPLAQSSGPPRHNSSLSPDRPCGILNPLFRWPSPHFYGSGVSKKPKASDESSTHRSGVAAEGAQLRCLKKLSKPKGPLNTHDQF
jgi:hypothetical protein